MEYSVFKVAGREERWPPKFVRHGQIYINLSNVFAECAWAFSYFRNKGIL
jgi:hypothetical protein